MTSGEAELRVDVAQGAAATTATFGEPGSYIVRVQAINDLESRRNPTYGFEFHCCWTNGYVRVCSRATGRRHAQGAHCETR